MLKNKYYTAMSNEHISIDHFAQMEIKIGEIKEAERVPETDKLVLLTVDVGEGEPRQIVSGIAEYIEGPESLIGKKFPFVTNLEPRKIKGIESQGMIMAAQADDGTFAFLEPHVDLPAGSTIR